MPVPTSLLALLHVSAHPAGIDYVAAPVSPAQALANRHCNRPCRRRPCRRACISPAHTPPQPEPPPCAGVFTAVAPLSPGQNPGDPVSPAPESPPQPDLHTHLRPGQVFAPLARLLGLYSIKEELEDLSFRFSDPRRYTRCRDRFDFLRKEQVSGAARGAARCLATRCRFLVAQTMQAWLWALQRRCCSLFLLPPHRSRSHAATALAQRNTEHMAAPHSHRLHIDRSVAHEVSAAALGLPLGPPNWVLRTVCITSRL